MRFALIALLLILPGFAHAEDKSDQKKNESKPDIIVVEEDQAPAEKPQEKSEEKTSEKPAEAKQPVDWVNVESTGTISDAKQGAMEKTLWKGQKRSEIEPLVQKLPNSPNLRSVLSLQRRLLLSKSEAGLIDNDIGPLRGNDLLIQRINKLMDMGLYDDAWELYTQKAEDPYDVSIAQQGMLLLVMKDDLATACLEEKVASAKYPKDKFFNTLDKACSVTLGGATSPQFPDNKILQSVYNDKSFSVAAKDIAALSKMTDFERALVLANRKIRYDGLAAADLAKMPPMLVTYFLMDRSLPDAAKTLIAAEADKRGLKYYTKAIARDEAWAKAKAIHDIPTQWPYVESALNSTDNPADIALYYGAMLAEAKPEKLSTATLEKALNVFLASGKALPSFWLDAAQKAAPEKPLFYIYLQAFQSLTPTQGDKIKPETLVKALQGLKPADMDQILAIIESLDKQAGFLNNPLTVYEKHSLLTLEGNYVMPSIGLNVLLETAPEKKQIGITVLAVLNSLAAKPDNMYSGTVRKALYSMLNVGLIEDAKQIGAETIASVLNKY